MPGGVDSTDLAAEAITDVIEGKRQWNSETDPDFLDYLCSVVDSKVSHLVVRTENRVTRRLAAASGVDLPESDVEDPHPDPATQVVNWESLAEFREAVLRGIPQDNLVEGIFDCLAAGMTKPADMAVLLETTVKEINKAQKRLKRKVEGVVKNTQSQRR